jgi:hypothetical protein
MESVRDGLSLYRWAALLGVVAPILALGIFLVDPAVGAIAGLSTGSGLSFASGSSVENGSALLLSALAGVLGLIALVLAIIAFTRWRHGAVLLERRRPWAGGGGWGAVPRTSAEASAIRGYRYSLYTMGGIILAAIIGAVIIAVVVIAATVITVTNGRTSTVSIGSSWAVVGAEVGLELVLLLLDLVLAWYVTESLHGFLALGPPRAPPPDLEGTRTLVYLGIVLGAASILNIVVVGLGAIGIAGPVLIFVATSRYHAAFTERLQGLPA